MQKLVYPAVFMPDENVGGYTVRFPDLKGCITEGDTIEEALAMAKDAMGLWLSVRKDEHKALPKMTNPASIQVSGKEFVTLVEWDELAYMKAKDERAVHKTLTIPSWMNELSKANHLRLSALLQRAIRQELGLV